MIVCKYTKVDSAVFIPHLDLLRAVIMGIRRSGIDVEYSIGFNPHMQLYFGQPLPIGQSSECEYFCAHTDLDAAEFVRIMNNQLPRGVKITKAANVQKDPSFAKVMFLAEYLCTMRGIGKDYSAVKGVLGLKEYFITYTHKDETVVKDVRELIDNIVVEGNNITLFLRCGNTNLRADRLMENLLKTYNISSGLDIVKKNMFDGGKKNLDVLLEV